MFTVRSLIENVFPVTGKNSPPKTLLDFPQKLHKRGVLNPVPEFTPQTVDHEVVALLKQSDRPGVRVMEFASSTFCSCV